jgi:hypothetical protein
VVLFLALSGTPALAISPANDPFERTWARTDRPVAEDQINRTWMWGPAAFTELMNEPYSETPGEERVVQYFDKSRMEITDPASDPNSIWHVTNGLLVVEMVTGRIQTGATRFEDVGYANATVAGDAGDPTGPTYGTISQLLNHAPYDAGAIITNRLNHEDRIADDPVMADYGVTAAELVPETNHRVASVFWDFMISDGLVYGVDGYIEDRLFQNPFYATGFPISEAYWATIQVAGTPMDVLLQCFERRCLTYTPGNDAGWQVEAGNVGRHYYEWRHGPIQTPTSGDIRIMEVFFDPSDEGDRSGEYVTIQSFDSYPVDLTGWTLTDDGPRATYVVPPFVLQPGASLRIYNCTGADTATELYTGRCSAWWNNDGDIASLFTATGTPVFQYGY